MLSKQRITKEMLLSHAFDIAKEDGIKNPMEVLHEKNDIC